MTPATQVKLLRFLQDRRFVPLGATRGSGASTCGSCRRRTATSGGGRGRALPRGLLLSAERVRRFEVPPLRERRDDVLPIAERFLGARGVPASKLSEGARDRLLTHSWPGNVRELENALERAVILAGEGEIRPDHLGGGARERAPSGRASELVGEGFSLDAFERELIHAALERAGGNKTRAAKLLGVTRRRLYSLLASHGGEDEP